MPIRARRETATYRGASGAYYGFTVFAASETLPRAARLIHSSASRYRARRMKYSTYRRNNKYCR